MKPKIAISLGDPAGIGPEVVLKAIDCPEVQSSCDIVIYGSDEVLSLTGSALSLKRRPVVIDDGQLMHPVPLGEISPVAGSAALHWVRQAATAVMQGEADALVTAPIHKEAAALAGSAFPGHTELLANLAGCKNVAMMLVAGNLRVVHVSTHVSLRKALDSISEPAVMMTVERAMEGCRLLGLDQPRIAVAGINPHAGEGGRFGTEERDILVPVISSLSDHGWNVQGPIAPDTVFARALRGEFDVVVAMYHDQGHIPVKLLAFDSGVNVTVGLPFIRTSPDHGTAFDIAGRGVASAKSMIEAILLAVAMYRRKP